MPIVWRYFGPTTKFKDIKGQGKDGKTAKRFHGRHGLFIFIRVYLLWMNGILKGQRTFTHGNLLSKSRVTRLKNSKSPITLCVTRPIWAPSHITRLILGPSRVKRKSFATLLELWCTLDFESYSRLHRNQLLGFFFFRALQTSHVRGHELKLQLIFFCISVNLKISDIPAISIKKLVRSQLTVIGSNPIETF